MKSYLVKIIGLRLDILYETSKLYNEFDFYKFSKEWFENNGYVVIFENGHHKVFYK